MEGWEARLNAVLEAARARPYVLGEHDCFRLACAVVEALTGVDRWPEFAGYTTKREALVKIAHYGSSFEKAGDWFFGERIELNFARRGDIAAVQSRDGEKHLAVVMGRQLMALGEGGIATLPVNAAHCAWRIG
jgi:hypothetical protein